MRLLVTFGNGFLDIGHIIMEGDTGFMVAGHLFGDVVGVESKTLIVE
jgi:hypothetical protein